MGDAHVGFVFRQLKARPFNAAYALAVTLLGIVSAAIGWSDGNYAMYALCLPVGVGLYPVLLFLVFGGGLVFGYVPGGLELLAVLVWGAVFAMAYANFWGVNYALRYLSRAFRGAVRRARRALGGVDHFRRCRCLVLFAT